MKVQTQKSTFQPISIVIETMEELQFFTALTGAISIAHTTPFGFKDADAVYRLYLQLRSACAGNEGPNSFDITLA